MSRLLTLLLLSGCVVSTSSFHLDGPVPTDEDGFANAVYQATGALLVEGNEVTPVDNGRFFDALIDDVSRAQRSIDIVTFIWRPGDPSDRLVEAIVARVHAGVARRVVVDAMASTGCQVRLGRRGLTLDRNHRKIFVIDGEVGFAGGVGIDPVWRGDGKAKNEWRESNVRVRGPVVAQLEQAFADTWLEEAGALVQRRFYGPLLAAGVRIWEYQPAMYHPNTMLVDDAIAVVGSINLDKLSQEALDEGSLVVFDRGFARQLEAAWHRDVEHCREVKP